MHISGGMLRSVYSDLSPDGITVELYDGDNALSEGAEALEQMDEELAEIARTLHQIY